MNNTKGVIYYATGKKYFNEAEESAISLKNNNSTIPITLFTDQKSNSTAFDNIIRINSGNDPFLDRIQYFRQSPYEKTIYIDTDTIIAGDIEPVFDVLDRFEIVARVDPFRNTAGKHWGEDYANINVPKAFPEYQCGVLGFNNSRSVKEMFKLWEDRYSNVTETDLIDQPFFREALYHSDIDIGTLPPEYNLLVNNLNILQEKGVIFHFNGGYSSKIQLPILENKPKEKIIKKINSYYPLRRAVYPGKLGQTRVFTEPNISVLLKVYRCLINHGFIFTIKKGLKKLRSLTTGG